MKSTGYEAVSCVMISIALSVVSLSLLASKGLAFIREIRNILYFWLRNSRGSAIWKGTK
jgi:hypothetical protein